MRYENIYCATIEKGLSFHPMLYHLLFCVPEFWLYVLSHGINAGRNTNMNTHNEVILNSRKTPTSQDKVTSLDLKDELLLTHGHGLSMKGLTRTRNVNTVSYATDCFTQQTQTPLTFLPTTQQMTATKEQLSAQNKRCTQAWKGLPVAHHMAKHHGDGRR